MKFRFDWSHGTRGSPAENLQLQKQMFELFKSVFLRRSFRDVKLATLLSLNKYLLRENVCKVGLFECVTIPLYNKIILETATPKEVREVTNKHVLHKNRKMCWEDQKRCQ